MPDRFLVHVVSSLDLDTAERIATATLAAGREAELLPLTVAVVDSGGNLVSFKREDGSGTLRGEIALAKACASLGIGVSSRTIGERMQARPGFQSAIAAASGGRFAAVPGGVVILDDRQHAIGAVGVSGDGSDRDEYAAIAGIRAAGLASHPAQPAENWEQAGL